MALPNATPKRTFRLPYGMIARFYSVSADDPPLIMPEQKAACYSWESQGTIKFPIYREEYLSHQYANVWRHGDCGWLITKEDTVNELGEISP